jgi:hypothetical protein
MRKNTKSQSAMEFIMTYGWALLVVLIVIIALVYFGLLKPNRLLPDNVQLFPGLDVRDAMVDQNSIVIIAQNNAGRHLFNLQVNAIGCNSSMAAISETISIPEGKTGRIEINCGQTAPVGTKFISELKSSYLTETNGKFLTHSRTGRMTFTVNKGYTFFDGPPGPDIVFPAFLGLNAIFLTSTTGVINITANKMVNASTTYGECPSTNDFFEYIDSFGNEHTLSVISLTNNTEYCFNVTICDTLGRCNSSTLNFTTYQEVVDCGEISVPYQTYVLTRSLSTGGDCFEITADNVVLDGKRFIVEGEMNPDQTFLSAESRSNITIKNFENVTMFNHGIRLKDVDNSFVEQVSSIAPIANYFIHLEDSSNNQLNDIISRAGSGVGLFSSQYNNISNVWGPSGLELITLTDSDHNFLSGINATQLSFQALWIERSSNNAIENVSVTSISGNAGLVIRDSSNNIFSGLRLCSNDEYDIYCTNSDMNTGSNISYGTQDGCGPWVGTAGGCS